MENIVIILLENICLIKLLPNEVMKEEEFMKIININQLLVFLGMKAVLPSMRKLNSASTVNISSLAGIIGTVGGIGYNASKFAVRGMTKVAALEFAEYNILVNSIHSGVIETPMIGGANTELINEISKTIPLKRVAKPQEVTNLVLHLVSDESSYSTGSEFIIDGGLFAQ